MGIILSELSQRVSSSFVVQFDQERAPFSALPYHKPYRGVANYTAGLYRGVRHGGRFSRRRPQTAGGRPFGPPTSRGGKMRYRALLHALFRGTVAGAVIQGDGVAGLAGKGGCVTARR